MIVGHLGEKSKSFRFARSLSVITVTFTGPGRKSCKQKKLCGPGPPAQRIVIRRLFALGLQVGDRMRHVICVYIVHQIEASIKSFQSAIVCHRFHILDLCSNDNSLDMRF